jgi:hypothetical protein
VAIVEDREAMPLMMRALLAALGVQVVLDAVAIVFVGEPNVLQLAVLGVDLGVLYMLARGSEVARALVRLAAALGMAFDAWLLAVTLAWAPATQAGRLAIGVACFLLALSAITFAVLGHADVKRWVFSRWLARKRAEIESA